MTFEKQKAVRIANNEVTKYLKSITDWKGAGPGKILIFWFKLFTSMHEVSTTSLNECIEGGMLQDGWLKEELY